MGKLPFSLFWSNDFEVIIWRHRLIVTSEREWGLIEYTEWRINVLIQTCIFIIAKPWSIINHKQFCSWSQFDRIQACLRSVERNQIGRRARSASLLQPIHLYNLLLSWTVQLDTLNFKAKTEEVSALLDKLRYIRRNVMYNGIFCR